MQLRHLCPAAPAYAACASARRGIHAASRLRVALRPPRHPYVVYLRHKCSCAAHTRRNCTKQAQLAFRGRGNDDDGAIFWRNCTYMAQLDGGFGAQVLRDGAAGQRWRN